MKRLDPSQKPKKKSGVGISQGLTKDSILAVAERLVGSVGPEGLQINTIANEMSVQPPAIYYHFKSRNDLIESLNHKLYVEVIAAGQGKGEEPEEWMRSAARNVVDFYYSRPTAAQCALWLTMRLGNTTNLLRHTIDIENRAIANIKNLLKKWQDEGKVKKNSYQIFIGSLYGASAIAVMYAKFGPSPTVSKSRLQKEVGDLVCTHMLR